jgi:hypothetical protein
MTVVIPPGFAQIAVELTHDLDPEPWYVTFGLDVSDAIAAGDDFPGKIESAFIAHLQARMSNAVVLTGVNYVVGQDAADNLTGEANYSVRGTSAASMLPQNCACLVSKNTGVGGRKNRGRNYWPGLLQETSVNAVGVIDAAQVTVLQTAMTGFYDQVREAGTSPVLSATPTVILHNNVGVVPLPTAFTSVTVKAKIATQRRRLR